MKYLVLLSLLLTCTHAPVGKKYQRSEWNHWSDVDRDCQNTRNEILIERSLVPVTLNKKGCKVRHGKWLDYYYPETHTSAKKVDIDHLVPLKHAHDHGGMGWSTREKEAFANDPENLVITNLKYNRKKGSKGIDEWLPVDQAYACKYIGDWMKIKRKYALKISEAEERTIKKSACTQRP